MPTTDFELMMPYAAVFIKDETTTWLLPAHGRTYTKLPDGAVYQILASSDAKIRTSTIHISTGQSVSTRIKAYPIAPQEQNVRLGDIPVPHGENVYISVQSTTIENTRERVTLKLIPMMIKE